MAEDRSTLEGALRAAQSRYNVFAHLAATDGSKKDDAAKAEADIAEAQKALEGFEEAPVDLAGTPPTLSDSKGNYAPNPEVARVGGTGVEASNSTESGEQAKSADEVYLDGAMKPQTTTAAVMPEIADATKDALVEQGKMEDDGAGDVKPTRSYNRK